MMAFLFCALKKNTPSLQRMSSPRRVPTHAARLGHYSRLHVLLQFCGYCYLKNSVCVMVWFEQRSRGGLGWPNEKRRKVQHYTREIPEYSGRSRVHVGVRRSKKEEGERRERASTTGMTLDYSFCTTRRI